MRKLKLIVASLALLVGGASISAWAQKDVTSQYITNATLSDGTNGWTKTFSKTKQTNDPADAFSNSVKGNNTIGYASEAYAGYGELIQTAYSMKQTITLPASSYRLVCYSFFRQGDTNDAEHNSKSLAYVVAGENKTKMLTLRSISAAGYANSQADGANCFDSKMYRNVVEFTIDEDNTAIEIGVEGTFDEMRSWCIVGMFELFDLNDLASVSSPTDVTYAITNSGFEYRDLTGWTNSGLKYQNNNWANKSGIGFAEQWVSGVGLGSDKSITQTLTNMPAGLYELSVYAHNIEQYNSDAAGTGMFLTANSSQTEIGAYGLYKVRTTLTTDGDITIGINLENCTGNWVAFDHFGLQFYGDPLKAYQDLLDETVVEAQALVNSGTLPPAAVSVLQQVINDNDNDDSAFTEESQFDDAIAAIQAAENTASALVAPYAKWLDMKALANTLSTTDNDNAEATQSLLSAISTQNTTAEAATVAEDINTATASLKSDMTTFVFAANPTSGNRFDLTFLMTNPDLTGLTTWKPADGWASEETDGNSQVMVNDSKTVGDKSYFYEYWSSTAKASGKFALYNAVTLPAGTFSMSCYAFAEDQGNSGSPTFDGVFFYANETQGSCVTSKVLAEQSISFINEVEQEVKIGLKTLTGNTRNWMGIGYVNLYKEYTDNTTYAISVPSFSNGSATVTVDEVEAEEAKALKTVTVTVTPAAGYVVTGVAATYNDGEVRTLDVANPSANVYTFQMPAYDVTVTVTTFQPVVNITAAGWATYCSPYALDFTGDIANLTNVYIVTGANGGYLTLTSVKGGTIPANKGLLLEGTKDTEVTVNIPVAASGLTDVSANKLVGVTTATEIAAEAGYVLMAEPEVAFYQNEYAFTVGANTAYLPVGFNGNSEAPAAFQFITEVTGISEVNAEAASGEIYNLAGQRVSKAVKGLYIQNGKKVLVK